MSKTVAQMTPKEREARRAYDRKRYESAHPGSRVVPKGAASAKAIKVAARAALIAAEARQPKPRALSIPEKWRNAAPAVTAATVVTIAPKTPGRFDPTGPVPRVIDGVECSEWARAATA